MLPIAPSYLTYVARQKRIPLYPLKQPSKLRKRSNKLSYPLLRKRRGGEERASSRRTQGQSKIEAQRSAQGGTVLYTGLRRRIDLAQSPASQGGKRGTMPKDLSPTCLYKPTTSLLISSFFILMLCGRASGCVT